jgi:ABC-type polysaccharide/polyol phosphate transport system ATPase subunit
MVRRTSLTTEHDGEVARPLEPAAIVVDKVSKTFSLPHEQRTTLKEHFLHPTRGRTVERQHALREVSFDVRRGEFFGIVGPNGSGKSTLLKVLAAIYPQDSGTVQVTGRLSPFIELGVGFNPELNARDNVLVNATLLGLTRRDLDAKFNSIIEFAELERFVDQKLKNYSSGMQLRLAFSIAIQVPFEVLLLDEVLAVGDASFQEKCYATFDEMRAARKTIVFVSHDLGTVERYCNRALLIRDGVAEAIGSPAEVIDLYEPGLRAKKN